MLTGAIKVWNNTRGFGFIRHDDKGSDVFCHISAVAGSRETLPQGQRVSFEVGIDKKTGKQRAENVRIV